MNCLSNKILFSLPGPSIIVHTTLFQKQAGHSAITTDEFSIGSIIEITTSDDVSVPAYLNQYSPFHNTLPDYDEQDTQIISSTFVLITNSM